MTALAQCITLAQSDRNSQGFSSVYYFSSVIILVILTKQARNNNKL